MESFLLAAGVALIIYALRGQPIINIQINKKD